MLFCGPLNLVSNSQNAINLSLPWTDFEGDFIEDVRRKLPVAQLLDNLENITSGLATFLARPNLAISPASPERNTTEIFVDILMRIEDSIQDSDTLNEQQRECIVTELWRHTSQTSLTTIGRTLRTLRQSFSGVARILQFLISFNRTLDGFTAQSFPVDCVTRMIDISFCGRCQQRIPPLCKNSCGALVRACFAAFYSGLQQEFDNLWGVVLQLVSVVEEEVRELFEALDGLLNNTDVCCKISRCHKSAHIQCWLHGDDPCERKGLFRLGQLPYNCNTSCGESLETQRLFPQLKIIAVLLVLQCWPLQHLYHPSLFSSLPFLQIIEVHAFDCNLLGLPRRRTVQETLVPNSTMTSAERLSGVFTYGELSFVDLPIANHDHTYGKLEHPFLSRY